MSRRRFFTPQSTYSAFIQGVDTDIPPLQQQQQHQQGQGQSTQGNTTAPKIHSEFNGASSNNSALNSNESAIADSETVLKTHDQPDEGENSKQQPLEPLEHQSAQRIDENVSFQNSDQKDTIHEQIYVPMGQEVPSTDVLEENQISHSPLGLGIDLPLWLSRKSLDEVVRRKTLLIFLNGMLGLGLMIALNQINWDGKTIIETRFTQQLRIALSLNSVFLVWQFLDRKRLQIAIKFRDKRRKTKFNRVDVSNMLVSMPHLSLISLLSLRPSTARPKLWIAVIICLIHPVPYINNIWPGLWPDKIGLLMFLRLFLISRVIRDYSEIWLSRRSIMKLSAFSTRTPHFDWWLSFKTVCFRRPVQFAIIVAVLAVLIYGYCIYIIEREAQPAHMWYSRAVWLAFQSLAILWTTDVYEEFNPITWIGRIACFVTAINGLLISSFIIGMVSQQLMPTRFEESALNWVQVDKTRNRERDIAARLIQFVWKNFLHEQELATKLRSKNPRLYEKIAEQEEKEFMDEFLQCTKLMKNVRRERIELEEQLNPYPSRSGNPEHLPLSVDADFDDVDERIETFRSDVILLLQQQDQALVRIESMLQNFMNNQILQQRSATSQLSQHAKSQSDQIQSSVSSDDYERSVNAEVGGSQSSADESTGTENQLLRTQHMKQSTTTSEPAPVHPVGDMEGQQQSHLEFEQWLHAQENKEMQSKIPAERHTSQRSSKHKSARVLRQKTMVDSSTRDAVSVHRSNSPQSEASATKDSQPLSNATSTRSMTRYTSAENTHHDTSSMVGTHDDEQLAALNQKTWPMMRPAIAHYPAFERENFQLPSHSRSSITDSPRQGTLYPPGYKPIAAANRGDPRTRLFRPRNTALAMRRRRMIDMQDSSDDDYASDRTRSVLQRLLMQQRSQRQRQRQRAHSPSEVSMFGSPHQQSQQNYNTYSQNPDDFSLGGS